MTDIPNQVNWVKVFQNLASDLKVEAAIAAASEIIVKQATAANLEALVTLKGLRGIIPNPITATRIDKSGYSAGVGAITLYTVPAATKLYISSAWLASFESVAAAALIELYIRDADDVFVSYIQTHAYAIAGHQTSSNRFVPGVEALTGYDIILSVPHANTTARASIHGWIEDV